MSTFHAQTIWHVPYQRNPLFTGREDALAQLHRTLQTEMTAALSQPLGISGMGGIGKTQTALEYAYRYRNDYQTVFWVQAASVAALRSGLVDIAHILELPEQDEQEQEIVVQAVLRWFRLHQNWLLIYDNMDDLALAETFLPVTGSGHFIFTTRAHALGGIAQRLDIREMEADIGALFLLRRAGLLAPLASLDTAQPVDQSIAYTISQELDGLPLAIDQAGAYIKETPCFLSEYLARYRLRNQELLRIRGDQSQYYPATVATTWSLSFEKVHQANPAAVQLLNLCAFCSPDAIPEEILTAGATHLGDVLSPVAADTILLDQAWKEALKFSLLSRAAQRTLQISEQAWNLSHPNMAVILHNFATFYADLGEAAEAERMYQQALNIREQFLEAWHPDTIATLYALSALQYTQGKQEAHILYERALAAHRQVGTLTSSDINEARKRLLAVLESLDLREEATTLRVLLPEIGSDDRE